MSTQETITLRLSQQGNIDEIIEDSVGLGEYIEIGMPFLRLAIQGSLAKALSFLMAIRQEGAAFDWDINIPVGAQAQTLYFTGGKIGDAVLVVAAKNTSVALQHYEEMMRINNEQTNSLRNVYGEMRRDNELYEEITRLNNELVDVQRELAKKNAEFVRLDQEKNRILGVAAHDLRNPLHAILLISEFLLNDIQTEQRLEFLAEIRASSQFMAQLIDDLLDVAMIESGQIQLEYDWVDMNTLARHNVQRNQLLAEYKQVQVDLIGELTQKPLVDQAKIEQVFNNLIGNAVKFSLAGSRVEVRLRDGGDQFIFEVQDWGSGIPLQAQKHLFTPFHKGQTGTAGEQSSGLGLTIVKRIVEAHGGSIRFESTPGIGTTFIVSIPNDPLLDIPPGNCPA